MRPDNTVEMSNESCTRLLDELFACVQNSIKSSSEKHVHDLRVAIRRFKQSLDTFKSCYPQSVTKKIAKRLKKAMRLAGCVRNLDVAMKFAEKWRLTGEHRLEAERKKKAHKLTNTLAEWVEDGCVTMWREELKTYPPGVEKTPVQHHARGLLSAMAASFFSRGNEAAASGATTSEMHGFRIAAKKFRYTMELFASIYGPVLEERIEQVGKLQSALGNINDCATLRDILAGDSAAARLRKRERRKIKLFRAQWKFEFSRAAITHEWVGALEGLSVLKEPKPGPPHRPGRRQRKAGGE